MSRASALGILCPLRLANILHQFYGRPVHFDKRYDEPIAWAVRLNYYVLASQCRYWSWLGSRIHSAIPKGLSSWSDTVILR